MARRIGWIALALIVAFVLLWAAGYVPVQAGEDDKTQQALEKILQNQEKMMEDLNLIKKELNVIRVRTR